MPACIKSKCPDVLPFWGVKKIIGLYMQTSSQLILQEKTLFDDYMHQISYCELYSM